ncbi:MAG: nickel-dependent lactate racemase [candidate division NC10 bacterium]|nr:nickel-dependent lactate racemase [candidate division NC10 bacterium]
MDVLLKYGHRNQVCRFPEAGVKLCILRPGRQAAVADETAALRAALAQPVGSPRLSALVSPGQTVAVVTSDITRPCPSHRLVPPVLGELNAAGVTDDDVLVVLGLGVHRPHTAKERERLVGPAVAKRVRCIDSDPQDVARVGVTRQGTPVEVFRPVLAADVRICLGVIEYHYFAGYSGGLKALVPGVSSAATIQATHRRMTEPHAVAGVLEGNPVRADLDEAGELIGASFLLNVVVDEEHRIVKAVAGQPRLAHQAGCRALDAFGRALVDRPADLVVVGAGGAPKDLNLYQAQKALDNARHVVRPGGVILLVAECPEGLGSETFAAWMRDPGGPSAILARIHREFVLGGHKAAAVAQAMTRAEVALVSAIPPQEARSYGFHPYDSVEAALAAALAKLPPDPLVVVMPEGGALLPAVSS